MVIINTDISDTSNAYQARIFKVLEQSYRQSFLPFQSYNPSGYRHEEVALLVIGIK